MKLKQNCSYLLKVSRTKRKKTMREAVGTFDCQKKQQKDLLMDENIQLIKLWLLPKIT